MSDPHENNPAGRLWLFFSAVVAPIAGGSARTAATTYLRLPDDLSPRYVAAIAELMRLPEEAATLVGRLSDPPLPVQKLVQPLYLAERVFVANPLLEASQTQVAKHIGPVTMSELETTSHILSRAHGDGTIDDATRSQIRVLAEQIVKLANADTETDPETRAVFLRFAHGIIQAVDLYNVVGPTPLVDELDRFSSVCRRVNVAPSSPLADKAGKLIGTVVMAVGLFTAPSDLSNAIAAYTAPWEQSSITEAPGPSYQPDEIIVEPEDDDAA